MSRPPDPDFELLLKDPNALLLKYQGLIQTIVYFYVDQGMFSLNQKEDIVQSVNLEVLKRIPSIQQHFNGSALLKTYFSAIARNICLHMGKKFVMKPIPLQLLPGGDADGGHQTDRYSIQQARSVFGAILVQLGPYEPKLRICLKLRYRHPVTHEDILHWWPECGNREMNNLLAMFGGDYRHLEDKDIYPMIVPYFNAAEGKVSGNDALRKWTASKIQIILKLLQTAFPGSNFDEEVVRILFEDRSSPFLLRE
jgi:DNA-directed RNA polymerase specialized sigma24 family protein